MNLSCSGTSASLFFILIIPLVKRGYGNSLCQYAYFFIFTSSSYFSAVLEKAQSAGDLVLDTVLWTGASDIFSCTGRRPASLCHGPLSVTHPSVYVLTFSLNIFFSETTDWILMKFHRNVPAMVLFRISLKNLILSKTLVAMANKLKFF